jgi:hypothetical protein
MEEKDKISVEIMPEADGEERNSVSETPKTDVKGTVKDSVFRDLFGNRKYALQLYQALHPEDTDVTEADIGDVTIHNIFTDQEYNDLVHRCINPEVNSA